MSQLKKYITNVTSLKILDCENVPVSGWGSLKKMQQQQQNTSNSSTVSFCIQKIKYSVNQSPSIAR